MVDSSEVMYNNNARCRSCVRFSKGGRKGIKRDDVVICLLILLLLVVWRFLTFIIFILPPPPPAAPPLRPPTSAPPPPDYLNAYRLQCVWRDARCGPPPPPGAPASRACSRSPCRGPSCNQRWISDYGGIGIGGGSNIAGRRVRMD